MYRSTASLRNSVCLACRYYHPCMTSGRVCVPKPKVRQMRVERVLREDRSSVGGMEQAGPICSRAYHMRKMLCMQDIASVSSQHAASRLNRGCRRAVACERIDWLGWRPASAWCCGTAMRGNVIWMTGCRAGLQHSLLTYRPWGWAAVSMISCAQGGLDVCMRGWVIFLLRMMVVLRMAVRSETGSQLPSPLQRKSPGPGARQTRAKFGRSLPRLRSGRCRSVGSQRTYGNGR